MSIAQLVAKALLIACPWLSPIEHHRQAKDITTVVNGDLEGALMLIATGSVETGYRERYARCDCKEGECDNGAALGVYQLHWYWFGTETRETICASNLIATRLAYKVLHTYRKRMPAHEAMKLYVGSGLSDEDPRIAPRFKAFDNLIMVLPPNTER